MTLSISEWCRGLACLKSFSIMKTFVCFSLWLGAAKAPLSTMKGPDSCKIGNVRSTRKIDDIFLDDPSLSSIGNASAASMTTQDEELEDSQGFSFEGLLGTWGSFTSWSQCSPDEKPQAPNRLTHQLWTQKIEAFRAMVEEHQTGFREFIERQRMRKLRTGRGKTGAQ